MSYSGSGRVMNMLKREKSLMRTNSWSLCFVFDRWGKGEDQQWGNSIKGKCSVKPRHRQGTHPRMMR